MNRVVLLAAAATLAASSTASAGGFGIPEVGVRRTAMASIIGRPDDASAIYHNPAGLILSHGWSLYASAGLALLDASFALQPWQGSNEYLSTMPGSDGYYGAVKPARAYGVVPMLALTGEIIPDKLVLGAAVFVGNATGASFHESDVTRYHLIDGYVVAPQAVLAASYRVLPSLSLGASVGATNIRVHGERLIYPIINGQDASVLIGSDSRLVLDGSGWAPTWMLSAFGQPTPRLSWGATLTGRVDASLEGPVTITYGPHSPTPGDEIKGLQRTQQLLPWAFMGGAAYDLTPNVELGVEGRYWLYRQYKSQHTDLVGIFFAQELDTPKNYHDSWEGSGGLRVHDLRQAPRLDLMAGMQYDHSPAPTSTETLDQPSFSHIGIHTGVRYTYGRYRLGASYLRYFYEVPTITDSMTSPPSDIKGHGANNIFTFSMEARL